MNQAERVCPLILEADIPNEWNTRDGIGCDRVNWEFYELGFIVLLSN